jgi:hypothetical protein
MYKQGVQAGTFNGYDVPAPSRGGPLAPPAGFGMTGVNMPGRAPQYGDFTPQRIQESSFRGYNASPLYGALPPSPPAGFGMAGVNIGGGGGGITQQALQAAKGKLRKTTRFI